VAIGQLLAGGANAAFDGERRASHLADRRPGTRAHRSLRNRAARRRLKRPHSRRRIGPDIGAANAQVEEHRRRNNRHARRSRVKADALIGQRAHDAVGGGQPKGAAARQHHRMHLGHHAARIEQIGLAGSGRAAAHIHRAKRGPGAPDDGAAGASLQVGIMPDEDAGHVAEIVIALGHAALLL
jgi:hypothetical protein